MSALWNFRAILDVYPDKPEFICVGTTDKGQRCKQSMFSEIDKSAAAALLDEMDIYKKLSSSYKYLEELAELTLCPRCHWGKSGNAQVQRVRTQWQAKIATYATRIEKEKEKVAMIKSERALTKLKKELEELKIRLQEEGVSAQVPISPQTQKDETISQPPNVPLLRDIPLATEKKENASANIITKLDPTTKTPPAIIISKVSRPTLTIPTLTINTPFRAPCECNAGKHCSSSSPSLSRSYSLPSLPKSRLELKAHSKIKQDQPPPPLPPKSPQRESVTFTKVISREEARIEPITFNFPGTPDLSLPEAAVISNSNSIKKNSNVVQGFRSEEQGPLPAFNTDINTELPNSVQVVENILSGREGNKRVPSVKSSTRSSYMNRAPQRLPTIWDDFDVQVKKTLAKEASVQNNKVEDTYRLELNQQDDLSLSRTLSIFNAALISFESYPLESDKKMETTIEPTKAPVKPAPVYFNPTISEGTSSLSRYTNYPTPEPRKSRILTEEDYGYAVVTPTLTRQKTYLPSRREPGLVAQEVAPKATRARVSRIYTEEEYGYAVVNPALSRSLSRYKTYLPARRQKSLATPPATIQIKKESMEWHQDPFLHFASDLSPIIQSPADTLTARTYYDQNSPMKSPSLVSPIHASPTDTINTRMDWPQEAIQNVVAEIGPLPVRRYSFTTTPVLGKPTPRSKSAKQPSPLGRNIESVDELPRPVTGVEQRCICRVDSGMPNGKAGSVRSLKGMRSKASRKLTNVKSRVSGAMRRGSNASSVRG